MPCWFSLDLRHQTGIVDRVPSLIVFKHVVAFSGNTGWNMVRKFLLMDIKDVPPNAVEALCPCLRFSNDGILRVTGRVIS